MARLDFPSNPSVNDTFQDYIWNGYAWVGFTTDVNYDEGNFDLLYVADFVGIGTTVTTVGDKLVVKGNAEFAGIAVTDGVGITTTKVLHVGVGGTTLTIDSDNATFAIGSATTTVNATLNGGTIPSIGMIIALGG